jgi:hypothetical protein
MVGSRAVNPLKAAWDVEVALRHLLAPERADLMSPVRAVSDAYDDLRAHDRGLAAGIQARAREPAAPIQPERVRGAVARRRARPFPAGQPQGAAMGALARDLRGPRARRERRFLVDVRARVPPRVRDGDDDRTQLSPISPRLGTTLKHAARCRLRRRSRRAGRSSLRSAARQSTASLASRRIVVVMRKVPTCARPC